MIFQSLIDRIAYLIAVNRIKIVHLKELLLLKIYL